jgi:transcription factor AP-4
MSPNSQLEHEKRVRREIANSNERRRMQSINTGFQSLKILIPHSCGEKLSKVCYVYIITRFSKKKSLGKKRKGKRMRQGQFTGSSKTCRINKKIYPVMLNERRHKKKKNKVYIDYNSI